MIFIERLCGLGVCGECGDETGAELDEILEVARTADL
jgi:hypothetical protein